MKGEDEGDDHAHGQQGADYKGQVLREPTGNSGLGPERARA